MSEAEGGSDDRSGFERFLREICNRHTQLVWVFTLSIAFAVIHVPYVFVVEWGSATSVVSVINLVGLSTFALFSGAMLRYCGKRTA